MRALIPLLTRVSPTGRDAFWLGFLYTVLWCGFHTFPAWPANDDPFYIKPVEHWSKTGELKVARQYGALTATAIGHLVAGGAVVAILGYSISNLFLACLLQQWLAIVVMLWAMRKLGTDSRVARFLACSFAVWPLFLGHGFTFMTDGPATAWCAVAISCFVVGLHSQSAAWLWIGALAAAWGFWIRQTCLLVLFIPIAYCWFADFKATQNSTQAEKRSPLTRRQVLTACCLFPLLCLAGLEVQEYQHGMWERLQTVAPYEPWSVRGKNMVIAAYGVVLLLGWLLLPIGATMVRTLFTEVVVGDRLVNGPISRRLQFTTLLGVGLLLLLPMFSTSGRACITNATGCFIQNAHFGPIFLSDMDEPGRWGTLDGVCWSLRFWQTLTLLAIAVAIAFVGLVCRGLVTYWETHGRSNPNADQRITLMVSCVMMPLLSAGLLIASVNPLLDRYWLFLFPAVLFACALLSASQRWQVKRSEVICGLGAMTTSLLCTIVFTHDMLAWNDQRWQYVGRFLAAGHSAHEIDGGRDVNAWLRLAEDLDTRPRPGDTSSWWNGYADIAIASGERPGWHVIDRLPFNAWATQRVHHLYVLQRESELSSQTSYVSMK